MNLYNVWILDDTCPEGERQFYWRSPLTDTECVKSEIEREKGLVVVFVERVK